MLIVAEPAGVEELKEWPEEEWVTLNRDVKDENNASVHCQRGSRCFSIARGARRSVEESTANQDFANDNNEGFILVCQYLLLTPENATM